MTTLLRAWSDGDSRVRDELMPVVYDDSLEETGQVLGLSIATVERDWQAARAWLFAAMKGAVGRDT